MTDKQTEALKLALEALEQIDEARPSAQGTNMNKQTEALRLAKMIEHYNAGVMSQKICEDYLKAAAELRRLHEVNQELLEALKELVVVATHEKPGSTCLMKAKAAIAKATGEQA